mmetsp:Transcript_14691/g.17376  ORF Transcript_14691/g.17376 Transcript_14691/m.17376 type:complete len:84 (+) Transcript_14691:105-356(+)|eukprot:CAMPEP_0198258472 /NCGR_PEP_ID=MMETSP1447-20131203/7883_1 /TAXON_ID=420782 /ORGANISM="Chaetoceros dichaeta, Strain CCMP1751" /LENGTH=83 /DNA_ID=CAMNT_0043945597 /DNA_START=116 /DNA_END=367 /DNA_ORIENTATION=-
MSTQGKTGENKQTQSVEAKVKVEAEPIAEAIEEDDEFEEFEPCRWDAHDEDAEDAQQWQDNWDDDDIEDHFTQQLRAELKQNK